MDERGFSCAVEGHAGVLLNGVHPVRTRREGNGPAAGRRHRRVRRLDSPAVVGLSVADCAELPDANGLPLSTRTASSRGRKSRFRAGCRRLPVHRDLRRRRRRRGGRIRDACGRLRLRDPRARRGGAEVKCGRTVRAPGGHQRPCEYGRAGHASPRQAPSANRERCHGTPATPVAGMLTSDPHTIGNAHHARLVHRFRPA
jgi:hypothetical protein